MPPMTGRVIAGRYSLASPIGRGAMGVVWRARDLLLDREVAVKEVVLNDSIGEQERANAHQRTLREARTAARLSHRGVVTVYDVAEEDGRPWIVMELVPSRSLDQVLAADGPMTPRRAGRVGQQLLSALAAAHSVGVLHRDVKPSNVLIASDGLDERAVLTDFGIAQFEGDPRLTQTGMVMGSPGFTAPERIRGSMATPASDLWSFGATIYAAVEGRGPYELRGGAITTMTAIINEDAPLAPSAGPLAPVIAALLRREPMTRPSARVAARMFADVLPLLSDRRKVPAQHTPTRPSAMQAKPTVISAPPARPTAPAAAAGAATAEPAPAATAGPGPAATPQRGPAATAQRGPAATPQRGPASAEPDAVSAEPDAVSAEPDAAAGEPAVRAAPAAETGPAAETVPLAEAATPAPAPAATSGEASAAAGTAVPAATPPPADAEAAPAPRAEADEVSTHRADPDEAGTDGGHADMAENAAAYSGGAGAEGAGAGQAGLPEAAAQAATALTAGTPTAGAAATSLDELAAVLAQPGPVFSAARPARPAMPPTTPQPQPPFGEPRFPLAPPDAPFPLPPDGTRRHQRGSRLIRRLVIGAALLVVAAAIGVAVALLTRHGRAASAGAGASPASSLPAPVQAIDHPASGLPSGWSLETVKPSLNGTTAGFSMGLPPGWQPAQSHLATHLNAPDGLRYMEVDLTAHTFPDDMVREAHYIESQALAQGSFPGYKRLSIKAVTIRGVKGALWAFTWVSPSSGRTMRVDDLLFVLNTSAGRQSYALYFTSPSDMFGGGNSGSLALFDKMLRTFQPVVP